MQKPTTAPPDESAPEGRPPDRRVALVGLDPRLAENVAELLDAEVATVAAGRADEALRHDAAVVIADERAAPGATGALTDSTGSGSPVLVAVGPPSSPPDGDSDEEASADPAFYRLRDMPPPETLAALASAALATTGHGQAYKPPEVDAAGAPHPDALREILEVVQRVDAQDLAADAADAAAEGLADLIGADSAACRLLFASGDNSTGARTPQRGIVGFVAHTGWPVTSETLTDDPRYAADVDNPGSLDAGAGIALPVSDRTGRCLAVLIALRGRERAAFSEADTQAAQALAHYLVGPLQRFDLAGHVERAAADAAPNLATRVYREEALNQYSAAAQQQGEPLRLSPKWMHWTYYLIVAGLATAVLFSVFARVTEYARGPAVIQLGGRTELTAPVGGTVTAVHVTSGERVAEGKVIATLYRGGEKAELQRIEQEYRLQLIKRLRRPNDPATEQALTQLRARLELARSRVEQRTVRAPADGVVGDVRVRTGQVYNPGQVLATLETGRARPHVVALIPGEHRPRLKPGMRLRLELQGFQYAYQELEVASVGEEIVGPEAARRYLGQDVAGAVRLTGPVVPVRANLEARTFTADGNDYRYHDGMFASAELAVSSDPLAVAIVPGLRRLLGGGNG